MEPALAVAIGAAIFLAVAVGALLGRYVWPRIPVSPDEFVTAQQEVARLQHENGVSSANVEKLLAEQRSLSEKAGNSGEEVARLSERVSTLLAQVNEQSTLISTLRDEQRGAATEATRWATEAAALKERELSLNEKITTQAAQQAEMRQQLTTEFENIANRVLRTTAAELSDSSQQKLSSLLNPLRERIQEFQAKVESTFDVEKRDVLSLREEIRVVVQTSHDIGKQADSLARALRGDSQVLGRWGELALERILETAGLQEGREYIRQGQGLGLRNEEGGLQRPDIIVVLPEQRTMIVDSKVPLTSYERLVAAATEEERTGCGKDFVRDVKLHIDGLAGKRYQENRQLQAHDCVLMFVPIEGALAAALVNDPELFIYAWRQNVVLVGPPTLLMTMRTVASIWRYQLQAAHAQDIARLAGELCDKISLSVVDLNTVSTKMTDAVSAHHEAVKRLATGKGNALSIGERIRSLGVRTRRPIPQVVIDGTPILELEDDTADLLLQLDQADADSAPTIDPTAHL